MRIISRWAVYGTLVLTTLCAVAPPVAAAPPAVIEKSKRTKIAVLKAQLKKLGDSAPVAKTMLLVFKLASLDPKKAATYYRTGLSKLPDDPSTAVFADIMGQLVLSAVKESGLPPKVVQAVVKTVDRVTNKFVPPEPTPTPYAS